MRALIIFMLACGPRASKPPYDTARLARLLHEDLAALATVAKEHLGDCPALVTTLQPVVERMRAHADEVKRVQQDPDTAKRLRKDVAAYDPQHRGVADVIGNDLGASFQTCPENKQLLELVDRIPEL